MPSPDFSFEQNLWQKGHKLVAGLDEVGRGSFAGPLIVGCVVFPHNSKFLIPDSIIINDSKKLTARKREAASVWIRENALFWGIGEASVADINNLGLTKATQLAFRNAIAVVRRQSAVDYFLIDALALPDVNNQMAIIKGDQKSITIAAASIIAKVHRDKLMTSLSSRREFAVYLWHQNKGYGTKSHREAIKKFGACKHHRNYLARFFSSSI